jgi:hypothetical protein
MFLRARPVSFSSAGPLVPGVAHAPSSLFQAGPHPTGPPLHLLLTHRLTDVRLRRARPLPAARTPSPAHPPDTRSHPTGPPSLLFLSAPSPPPPAPFPIPLVGRHWSRNPKSSATALLNLSPKSSLPPLLSLYCVVGPFRQSQPSPGTPSQVNSPQPRPTPPPHRRQPSPESHHRPPLVMQVC